MSRSPHRQGGAEGAHRIAKARAATIRRDLIAVAARTARHARGHVTLHLPEGWHRQHEWQNLFAAACGPPPKRPDQPRPARTRGPRRPPHSRPRPRNPGQAAEQASGRTLAPPIHLGKLLVQE